MIRGGALEAKPYTKYGLVSFAQHSKCHSSIAPTAGVRARCVRTLLDREEARGQAFLEPVCVEERAAQIEVGIAGPLRETIWLKKVTSFR